MSDVHLDERFESSPVPDRLRWMNEPSSWRVQTAPPSLLIAPGAGTDFWQRTHYGFRRDDGHFLYLELEGDFALRTHVRFHPAHQFDQAGLMVRSSAETWIKTAVEHELDGPPQLGAVVTNLGYSDWSQQDFAPGAGEVQLQIRRQGDDFLIGWAMPGSETWRPLRTTHLHALGRQSLQCGLYACSPKGQGFWAEFKFLRVTQTG